MYCYILKKSTTSNDISNIDLPLPKHLPISEFTYELPADRIARYPLAERDASQLLVHKNGETRHTNFGSIASEIPAGTLLVFNNSRVVEARLLFQKETGGIIEIFALEPHEQYADITTAMQQQHNILYKCLVGGASKWKPGMILSKSVMHDNAQVEIAARITERRADCFVIEFTWEPPQLSFAAVLHALGQIPIPPYLQRPAAETDTERYQTIYAKADGSVAAPTAGLHFTPAVMEQLAAKHIDTAYVTLHVGAGTFMPVKSDTMEGHSMHAEFIEADIALIEKLIQTDHIMAVGTTSCRTLESLYWMGVKAFHQPNISLGKLELQQWEVYETWQERAVDKAIALQALIEWIKKNNIRKNDDVSSPKLIVKTSIIIAPGYTFRIIGGMVTNFHQPQSTLLLLVAALVGPQWKAIYDYALQHGFRFLSYGDSSLLFKREQDL